MNYFKGQDKIIHHYCTSAFEKGTKGLKFSNMDPIKNKINRKPTNRCLWSLLDKDTNSVVPIQILGNNKQKRHYFILQCYAQHALQNLLHKLICKTRSTR